MAKVQKQATNWACGLQSQYALGLSKYFLPSQCVCVAPVCVCQTLAFIQHAALRPTEHRMR